MSLVWLPLSVSADISLSTTGKASCYEMNLTMPMSMPGHDMSTHSIHSAMTDQATDLDVSVTDKATHESMMKQGCCDQCDENCDACVGMSSCKHRSNGVSAFILFDQYSSQSHPLAKFSIEQSVQYHNQIITPDIRPPIV